MATQAVIIQSKDVRELVEKGWNIINIFCCGAMQAVKRRYSVNIVKAGILPKELSRSKILKTFFSNLVALRLLLSYTLRSQTIVLDFNCDAQTNPVMDPCFFCRLILFFYHNFFCLKNLRVLDVNLQTCTSHWSKRCQHNAAYNHTNQLIR